MRTGVVLLAVLGAILLSATALTASRHPDRALREAGFSVPRPYGDDEGTDDEADDEATDETGSFVERFVTDPLESPHHVTLGRPLERLRWNGDAPAYSGDPPGSLTATYDAGADAGLFGFLLSRPYDHREIFTAGAAFVVHSDGFRASPDGFFQLSWGLWNTATTGLERTGSPASFAGDTFELIEFDYFPNVSPYFGGPFLAPSVFGRAAVDDPSFEFGGSFVNFASLFDLQVALPFDVPLLAVLEHRPDLESLTVQVYRIVERDGAVALQAAVGPVSLELLTLREYEVDAIGLTLWTDGFGGPAPSVHATLTYHALVVVPRPVRPEELLQAGPER